MFEEWLRSLRNRQILHAVSTIFSHGGDVSNPPKAPLIRLIRFYHAPGQSRKFRSFLADSGDSRSRAPKATALRFAHTASA